MFPNNLAANWPDYMESVVSSTRVLLQTEPNVLSLFFNAG
jgi:hypothetical protein